MVSNSFWLLAAAVVVGDLLALFACEAEFLFLNCVAKSLLDLGKFVSKSPRMLVLFGVGVASWEEICGALGVDGFVSDGKLVDGFVSDGKLVDGKLVLILGVDAERFPPSDGFNPSSPLVFVDGEFGEIGEVCVPDCGFFAVLLQKLLLPNGGRGMFDKL